jgi:hypothetical protein
MDTKTKNVVLVLLAFLLLNHLQCQQQQIFMISNLMYDDEDEDDFQPPNKRQKRQPLHATARNILPLGGSPGDHSHVCLADFVLQHEQILYTLTGLLLPEFNLLYKRLKRTLKRPLDGPADEVQMVLILIN